jgi:hypothetical protein
MQGCADADDTGAKNDRVGPGQDFLDETRGRETRPAT